jgi:hypothetical protein
MLEESFLGSLAKGFTTGLEEWDEMLSRSRNCASRISGKRPHVVAEDLQYIGVSAASGERCADLIRSHAGFDKFPRFGFKQDGKGRKPKISVPSVVQNKVVPGRCSSPDYRVRSGRSVHELAERVDVIFL